MRDAGAIPATIAVIGGRIRVGLDDAQLEYVASSGTFLKASRRNLAAIGGGRSATPRPPFRPPSGSREAWVSAYSPPAAWVACIARPRPRSISPTTSTSSPAPMAPWSSARASSRYSTCRPRSMLSRPAACSSPATAPTRCRASSRVSSELPLDDRVDSPGQAADLVRTHRELELPGALVLAQPVPAHEAIDRIEIETALAAALTEAQDLGIKGKAVTPFLLGRLRTATGGRTLRANRALIVANARLAGEVAAALAENAGN